jgi:hypothetical protein
VSWVRVDCDVPTDERLLCTGFALYWPAILIRAKKGAGHLPARAASPTQLAHLWGSTVEMWQAAIEHFVRVGLLVERADGDGYDVEEWKRTQLDPTNAERQKRHRESSRNGGVTDESVTRNGGVTGESVTEALRVTGRAVTTVQDKTVHTGHDKTSSSSSLPPPSGRADEDDDLKVIVSTWLGTQLTERGHTRMQATGHELAELARALKTHGRERTVAAIGAAANSAEGGTPRLALFSAIVERGVFDGPAPSKAKQSSKQSQAKPDSKRVNDAWAGVADQGDTF